MSNLFSDFTNQYSVNKTLRFELKPVGKTKDLIDKNNFIEKDEEKAEALKIVKMMIDQQHQKLIETVLTKEIFKKSEIKDLFEKYEQIKNNKSKKDTEYYNKQKELREKLKKKFIACQIYKTLGNKNFLMNLKDINKEHDENKKRYDGNKELSIENIDYLQKLFDEKEPQWNKEKIEKFNLLLSEIQSPKSEDSKSKKEFKKLPLPIFIDYFVEGEALENLKKVLKDTLKKNEYIQELTPDCINKILGNCKADDFTVLQKNRENFYSEDRKQGTIPFRIIHENFPLAFRNILIYDKHKDKINQFSHQELMERQNIQSLDEVFNGSKVGELLTQSQINKYNNLLGGYEDQNEDQNENQIKGLNNLIKEYNDGKENKPEIPRFKPLKNQILSNEESNSFVFNQPFDIDTDLLDEIKKFYKDLEEKKILKELDDLLDTTFKPSNELHDIFVTKQSIKNLSKNIYGEWDKFNQLIEEKKKVFSIADIDKGILKHEISENHEISNYFKNKRLRPSEEETIFERVDSSYKEVKELLEQTILSSDRRIPETEEDEGGKGYQETSKITSFINSIQEVIYFLKPMYLVENREKLEIPEANENFYSDFDDIYENLEKIFLLSKQVRAYLGKKPYSQKKINIIFGETTFLDGWTEEGVKGGYLLKKEIEKKTHYYLGVSSNDKLFNTEEKVKEGDEFPYERLSYYQVIFKSLCGASYSGLYKNEYKIDKSFQEIFNLIDKNKPFEEEKKDLVKKLEDKINGGRQVNVKEKYKGLLEKVKSEIDVHNIENSKKFLIERGFKSSSSFKDRMLDMLKEKYPMIHKKVSEKTYEKFEDFMEDVEKISVAFKIFEYKPISKASFEQAMNDSEKPFLLFEIYSKDFQTQEDKKKNLQTQYFEYLMSPETEIDLGTGKIFHRRGSIDQNNKNERVYKHKEGDILKAKNESASNIWKRIDPKNQCKNLIEFKNQLNNRSDLFEEIESRIKDGKKQEHQVLYYKNKENEKIRIGRIAKYDIIKDKRYTEDKYLFHLSTKLNFSKKSISNKNEKKIPYATEFNNKINETLHKKFPEYVLGIDRGEKNLLYYSLINAKTGDIKKQGDLNIFNNVNYQKLLKRRGENRKLAQKNLGIQENIKNLKKGYLSLAIHKIIKLAVDHEAIIILEKLDPGFINKRKKFEHQIYQQFQKAIITKLNYLTFKDKDEGEDGHYMKGYQLTPPYFENSNNQHGILFFINPFDTSITDPITGFFKGDIFRKLGTKKEELICWIKNNLVSITYDKENKSYIFKVSQWSLYSKVQRSSWNRNKREIQFYDDLTCDFRELFKKLNVNEDSDYKGALLNAKQEELNIFFRYFKLVLQTRNQDKEDNDFIQSPVHPFYDSHKVQHNVPLPNNGDVPLPNNGDANGAYNIARKGIIVLDKLNYSYEILNYLDVPNKSKWLSEGKDKEEKKHEALSSVEEKDREEIQKIFDNWLKKVKQEENTEVLSEKFWKGPSNELQPLEKEFLEDIIVLDKLNYSYKILNYLKDSNKSNWLSKGQDKEEKKSEALSSVEEKDRKEIQKIFDNWLKKEKQEEKPKVKTTALSVNFWKEPSNKLRSLEKEFLEYIIVLDELNCSDEILNYLDDSNKSKWSSKGQDKEEKKREALSSVEKKDREEIQKIFDNWLKKVKQEENTEVLSENFWKGPSNDLESLEKEFLKYADLYVSTENWKNYVQKEEIVQRQIKKYEKINK